MGKDETAAARALVAARWKKTTKAQRKEIGGELAAARNEKLTPEQRKLIASRAAKARWKKRKKP